MFLASDLPKDREQWINIFLKCMGSPDSYGRQLDGMGGGVSSVSKVCVVAKSERADADVDYTFAQVLIDKAFVDFKGNCGNMSAAVGPFAVDQGLVAVKDGQAIVRIFNTNTQKIIHSHFTVRSGRAVYEGDLEIPGVSGTAAPIRLDFVEPGGATTGKLLPTGSLKDRLNIPELGLVEVSLVDAANACVFVKAKNVGMTGHELPTELEAPDILKRLDLLRRHASVAMGISATIEEARKVVTVPYVALVTEAADFKSLSGEVVNKDQQDVCVRVIASGQPHRALPLTVSLCTAVAARMQGTVVSECLSENLDLQAPLKLGMPSGVLTLAADVVQENGQWHARSGGFYRTARPLFEGRVLYRP